MAKSQIPVIGGLRKVLKIPPAGTTIAEFGSGSITLAQLKTALGVTSSSTASGASASGSGGTGATAAITPGPGLAGGGQLVGTVPLRVNAPIPAFIFGDDGGGGGDGDPGPPGLAGAAGAQGATGAPGPMGPAVIFIDDGPEGEQGPPSLSVGPPGATGPQGATGVGTPGTPVYLVAEDGYDGDIGPPGIAGVAGAQGATGAAGPAGPAVFLFAEDGADGDIGPPGAAGSSTSSTTTASCTFVVNNLSSTLNTNLTTEGTLDWFSPTGLPNDLSAPYLYARKRAGFALRDYGWMGFNGTGSFGVAGNDWNPSWNSGDSMSNNSTGSDPNGYYGSCASGEGFSFSVPADRSTRVLRLYSSNGSPWSITCTMSDGNVFTLGAQTQTNTQTVITYNASKDGQRMLVQCIAGGAINLGFMGITLGTA